MLYLTDQKEGEWKEQRIDQQERLCTPDASEAEGIMRSTGSLSLIPPLKQECPVVHANANSESDQVMKQRDSEERALGKKS